MTRKLALALLVLFTVIAAGRAAPADAAVTCNFASGALTIQSSAELDSATIVRSGGNIVVKDNQNAVNCGAQATVQNTHVIAHADGSGGESYFTIDLRGGPFSPGYVDETGASDEIDIQAVMGAGDDRLYLYGAPGDDFIRLGRTANGQAGINLNAGLETAPGETPNSDADIRDTELFVVMTGAGNDRVFANGGTEFDGPMTTRVEVNSDVGDDEVAGGSGRDHFAEGPGNDKVSGGWDNDIIVEYGGAAGDDDVYEGGLGFDEIAWADFNGAMRVDLRLAGRQDTGAGGRDVVSGFEGASTADGNDVLIGTDADNELSTGDGEDLVMGLGGADRISGGDDVDTLSYATPPAGVRQGVTVDLAKVDVDQDTGGAGIDRIDGIQNLIGSPFADVLSGNQGNNRLEIRDGTGDTVTCSAGADTVLADVEGTDAIAQECESVELDFRPDTRIDAGPARLSRDATPSFRFGATKQGATFECSLDGGAFGACSAAHTLPRLPDGAHSLRVRARDLLGAIDLTPAEHAFSTDATRPRIGRARLAGGGVLRYRVSEAARVRIAIARGGSAKPRTIVRRARKGANRIALRGGRATRVTLVATDLAGNRSKARVIAGNRR